MTESDRKTGVIISTKINQIETLLTEIEALRLSLLHDSTSQELRYILKAFKKPLNDLKQTNDILKTR